MNTAEKLYSRLSKPYLSQNNNCDLIAARLGISGKYFLQIMNGTRKPSPHLRQKIRNLYQKLTISGKKAAYKPRLVISYDDQDLHQKHQKLSNEERKQALTWFCILKDISNPNEDMQKLYREYKQALDNNLKA